MNPILKALKDLLGGQKPTGNLPFQYPPPIAKTLGFDLVAIDEGKATIEMKATTEKHANPMGTVHGGVLCDIGDAAIGTAHSTTLEAGESFTSIDLKINFFRPVWNGTLRASAKPIQQGKTISYYECQINDEKKRLIAVVTSTVMTLRGDAAKGR
jgi:uncharacterized protein (TIGR00369 family)